MVAECVGSILIRVIHNVPTTYLQVTKDYPHSYTHGYPQAVCNFYRRKVKPQRWFYFLLILPGLDLVVNDLNMTI